MCIRDRYPYIHANSVMLPADHPNNPSKAVDLGIPILHSRITGYRPSVLETTTVKLKEGDTLGVYAVADEAITEDFEVVLTAARVKGEDVLVREAGASFDFSFSLDTDFYTKGSIPISPDNFNELPGGFGQSKPAVYPWITYARNKVATTVNTWYDFDYPNYVSREWQDLSFNLVNKSKAYILRYLGVLPDANSYKTRIYVEGRETNPEFETKELPNDNFFLPALTYDTNVNAGVKKLGPTKLLPERLIHGVKASIQHLDNGTSISDNGAGVDGDEIAVTINGVPFEMPYTGMYWDGYTLTLNLEELGFSVLPETNIVIFNIDDDALCPNSMFDTLTFYVLANPGPMASAQLPLPDEITSCEDQQIQISITDADGVDETTISLSVHSRILSHRFCACIVRNLHSPRP